MAIIDTLRFRNTLVDGEIAEEEAAQEFVTVLDETFEDVTGNLATKQDLAQQTAEIKNLIKDLETRMVRTMMWVAFGIIATLAAVMTMLQVFVG